MYFFLRSALRIRADDSDTFIGGSSQIREHARCMARQYSRSASEDVKREMHAYKKGKLKSGSGKKVTSRKQAIAIGLSEARRKGKRVPKKPARSRAKGRKRSAARRAK